jgi:hypothetical protein
VPEAGSGISPRHPAAPSAEGAAGTRRGGATCCSCSAWASRFRKPDRRAGIRTPYSLRYNNNTPASRRARAIRAPARSARSPWARPAPAAAVASR